MENSFSIWILSRRPEIFDWRNSNIWPEGFNVVVFEKIDLLLSNLAKRSPEFIILDWDLVSQNVQPVVSKISRTSPLSEIYLINLPEDHPIYTDIGKHELSGIFPPDYESGDLRRKIQENAELKQLLNRAGIVGRSHHHKRIASVIRQIAPTDATVLITGESGTGKEFIARAMHDNSNRSGKPFISVNGAAISETLLESELFGHEKGAFTGADKRRAGYFETASGGSIFLDEIGEFKLDLQSRLLRILEQKAFYRVGGNEQIKADVRVICATNRELKQLVDEGRFRADLYYRLSVIHIITEPLRNRPEDIAPLANYFLHELKNDVGEMSISPEAMALLGRYSWPGNVRELKNFIQSAAYLSSDNVITGDDVEQFVRRTASENRALPVITGKTDRQADFEMIYHALINLAREVAEMKEILVSRRAPASPDYYDDMQIRPENGMEVSPQSKTIKEMEKEMIERALQESGNNRKEAARALGIGERTLYRKIKEYGIS